MSTAMITPQQLTPNLAESIGLKFSLYFKREDLHPYGSHKGRSLPLMVGKYAESGKRNFVISSSGNAALAAAKAIGEYNARSEKKLNLKIFIGDKISLGKIERINDTAKENGNIIVRQTRNPKQMAFLMAKNDGAINLRQSTDDNALTGYVDLARELSEIQNLSAVFVPTSSGTTAQGLHLGFKKIGINPQIHIVQTNTCHPFVNSDESPEEGPSLASAISDKVGHRKTAIARVISESKGTGWVADNTEILEAMELVKHAEDIAISPNSALSVAGLKKAVSSGWKFNGPVVCLVTGP